MPLRNSRPEQGETRCLGFRERPRRGRRLVGTALTVAALTGVTASLTAAYGASTAAIATETPDLSQLPEMKSVSQYGITWTFENPARVGHFVNGDFYVVGPVTVTNIDPRPLTGTEVPVSELAGWEKERVKNGRYVRNGSMLNPPARDQVAYDSGIRNYFHPELLAQPPVRMKPGDWLVSTISLRNGEKTTFPYHGDGGQREKGDDSPLRTAAILTCVAAPQPLDAFRPSYGDRQQKIYRASQLHRELLRRLPKPADAPDLETWIQVFQRPWLNPCFFGFDQPMENMPHYGQWVGQAQSVAGLMLMLDYEPQKKERFLVNVVQVGIDYWGLVRNGHRGWEGWGGHGSGRKFPIVLAGLLLGDQEMAAPTKTFPKVEFGEDNQTMYGQGWTGAKALFAGHSGIQSATGKAERPEWGPYEHLPPSQWDKGNGTSEAYRRANTSSSWVGQALVIRMLHAEKSWNHDAFLDYVDRWMTEDDKASSLVVAQYFTDMGLTEKSDWNRQGFTWEPFVKTMWTRYRDRLDEVGK